MKEGILIYWSWPLKHSILNSGQHIWTYNESLYVESCAHQTVLDCRSPLEKGTLQDAAALLFNNLPKELKTCDDLNIFTSRLFKYLRKFLSAYILEGFLLFYYFKSTTVNI